MKNSSYFSTKNLFIKIATQVYCVHSCDRHKGGCLSSVQSLSRVRLSATPWTAAHQASLSMRFSRQGYWSRLSFPGHLHCRQILYRLSYPQLWGMLATKKIAESFSRNCPQLKRISSYKSLVTHAMTSQCQGIKSHSPASKPQRKYFPKTAVLHIPSHSLFL